jgi:predicted RNA-binding protein with PUA-like domain
MNNRRYKRNENNADLMIGDLSFYLVSSVEVSRIEIIQTISHLNYPVKSYDSPISRIRVLQSFKALQFEGFIF